MAKAKESKLRHVGFDKALHLLKRKYRVTRAQWNGICYLELRTDSKGNVEIFNVGGKGDGIRHSFDQNEILAVDWKVL